jgi:hypothetical protein
MTKSQWFRRIVFDLLGPAPPAMIKPEICREAWSWPGDPQFSLGLNPA